MSSRRPPIPPKNPFMGLIKEGIVSLNLNTEVNFFSIRPEANSCNSSNTMDIKQYEYVKSNSNNSNPKKRKIFGDILQQYHEHQNSSESKKHKTGSETTDQSVLVIPQSPFSNNSSSTSSNENNANDIMDLNSSFTISSCNIIAKSADANTDANNDANMIESKLDEELPNFGREFTSSSEHILDRVTGRFSPLLLKSNMCNFDEELPNFGEEFISSNEHVLDRVTGRFSPLLLNPYRYTNKERLGPKL
jgi:hypothetical protein